MIESTTIAGDRPTIIGTIAYGATTRETIQIEGLQSAQLLDYIRELEAIARTFANAQRDGTIGLRAPVLAFAWLMETKLRRHDDDRGPSGWSADPPDALLERVQGELIELNHALGEWFKSGDAAKLRVAFEAADVANMAMMVADRVGGLEGVGPGWAFKRSKRLHQAHRMLERTRGIITRMEGDGITPNKRISWIRADAKALEWMLTQLDPRNEHQQRDQLNGDGSGQALPEAHPTEERTFTPPQP